MFSENKRKKPVSLHLEDSVQGNIDVRQDKQLKIVERHWRKLYSKHEEETESLVEETDAHIIIRCTTGVSLLAKNESQN